METEKKVAAICARREVRCYVSEFARPELFQRLVEEPRTSHILLELAELGLAMSRLGARVLKIDGNLRILVCRDSMMIPLEGAISAAFEKQSSLPGTAGKEGHTVPTPLGAPERTAAEGPSGGSPGSVSHGGPAAEAVKRTRKELSELSEERLHRVDGQEEEKGFSRNKASTSSPAVGTSGREVLPDAGTAELRELWANSLLDDT